MKVLCVYDPGLLFVERSANISHNLLVDIQASFAEHERARRILGFKFALSDNFYELLYTEPDIGQYETWEVIDSIIQMLLLDPEDKSTDYCIIHHTPEFPFENEPNILFSPRIPLRPNLLAYCLDLLGACFQSEEQLRICYATGLAKYGFTSTYTVRERQGHTLYIIHNLFEWAEQYRLLRNGNGKRLPSEFSPIPDGEQAWLFFCPAESSFQEETNELEMEVLDDGSIRLNNWRRVAGRNRGYKDCWGNIWMWNDQEAQQHWDVQITRRFQNLIGAEDSHVNVQPAGLEYPHEEPIPQGSIRHGLGGFDPLAICTLGCPHRSCPRKTR